MTGEGPDAPAASPERIRAALRTVPEPCGLLMRTPLDICEMGLVEEVHEEAGRVRVTLVLTDPSCVHFDGMRRYITDVLLALPGVRAVEVTVSRTVLWTPDRRQGAGGGRAADSAPVIAGTALPVRAVDSARGAS
ncbi:iron-sulfur cluster assembly protein [Streptomyces sp. NPDC093085]|uniref:metal-sulfur cluster assembly factor n=1 Tax=Streptomyces sp. NPDC093085 TaxID=3155068 RepID=UPI003428C82D